VPRARRPAASDPGTPEALLATYRDKRDFDATPEPAPVVSQPVAPRTGPLTFVVQKHRATALHYDFRLEVDGVLKSWPVPKGPSANPADRRLAVMTEDHPLDYATFEGIIPAGQYGAGEVIVWDRGTYSPDEDGVLSFHDPAEANQRMRDGIANGKVSVQLRGERMKGSWALVRTTGGDHTWLMLKHRDEAVDTERELTHLDSSVLSGITIADLQAGRRIPPAPAPVLRPSDVAGARAAPPPAKLQPMQALLAEGALPRGDWLLEPKFDGVRALAIVEAGAIVAEGAVTLFARSGAVITDRYPALVKALARQPAASIVLDGEVVATDERGVPSFERLQRRMHLTNPIEIATADRQAPVTYYAFDLLHIDGIDLRESPLTERKRLLQSVVLPSALVRPVEVIDASLEQALAATTALGLEGVMAKRADSRYETGKRSGAWRKVKPRATEDFLVVGFTEGVGARRSTFGSLSLATREGRGLRYAGQVGSGFNDATLRELRTRLDALLTTRPAKLANSDNAPAMTRVRPELVVEVAFAHVTEGGQLRAPVFVRTRDDKPAAEVSMAGLSMVQAGAAPVDGGGQDALAAADDIALVLAQLDALAASGPLRVAGAELKLTNLNRVLWPAFGDQPEVTKRDLLRYYASMSPYLLRQLRDRPVTLTRYPNGIDGSHFYQKHLEDLPGPFVETVQVFSESNRGDSAYVLANNLPTLLWLGQIADIALHTTLARVNPEPDGMHLKREFDRSKERLDGSLLNYPDFILFDLDPYIYAGTEQRGEEPELNRRAFQATCEVALALHEIIEGVGLASFVKTSGATGLHIYVPVLRQYDYATIRGLAHTVGGFLVQTKPALVTMEWQSERRRGRVFFDANQNARSKNLAAAYSPRAKPGAPVSMPLRWTEVGKIYPTEFTVFTAAGRIAAVGDLWANILDAKQDIQTLLEL